MSIQWSVGIDRSPWYYLAVGKDGLRKDSELRKCKGAVLVAERGSEVTRMEVVSKLPVSVFVMVRPYSGHPIKRQGRDTPLVRRIARKWGENGQYYTWILAKGVCDKTVGKPPTSNKEGLGDWMVEPQQTGSPAVT